MWASLQRQQTERRTHTLVHTGHESPQMIHWHKFPESRVDFTAGCCTVRAHTHSFSCFRGSHAFSAACAFKFCDPLFTAVADWLAGWQGALVHAALNNWDCKVNVRRIAKDGHTTHHHHPPACLPDCLPACQPTLSLQSTGWAPTHLTAELSSSLAAAAAAEIERWRDHKRLLLLLLLSRCTQADGKTAPCWQWNGPFRGTLPGFHARSWLWLLTPPQFAINHSLLVRPSLAAGALPSPTPSYSASLSYCLPLPQRQPSCPPPPPLMQWSIMPILQRRGWKRRRWRRRRQALCPLLGRGERWKMRVIRGAMATGRGDGPLLSSAAVEPDGQKVSSFP